MQQPGTTFLESIWDLATDYCFKVTLISKSKKRAEVIIHLSKMKSLTRHLCYIKGEWRDKYNNTYAL